jgi:hypothetical protein
MKKIVASVGLVALGASGVHAASPSPFNTDAAKPWTVSATLRGFYDDNYQTIPNDAVLAPGQYRASSGFEVSPAAKFDWQLEQTQIGLGYTYALKYYDHQLTGKSEHYDQSHSFIASLDHSFNERYQISVADSFVIGQEPDLLRAGNTFSSFQRIPGDNIRNYGSITFNAELTRQLSLQAGYANSFYDYADDTVTVNASSTSVPSVTVISVSPSTAGTLNRMEQVFHLDGRYQLQPQTIGVVGYQYSDTAYTEDQYIGGGITNNAGLISGRLYRSDVRNNSSHYGYVGVDHTFRADLAGSLRVGARYNDYYNDPFNQNEPSPYVNASLKYTYMAASYAEIGASYDRTASDLFTDNTTSITTDAQTVAAWLALHQKITPRLQGVLTAQIQNSIYQGGTINNVADMYYLVGLSLQYTFCPHLSAEVGYNYDQLASDIPNRSFDRNRVYIGVTASY